jgi:WD40 repeat protein
VTAVNFPHDSSEYFVTCATDLTVRSPHGRSIPYPPPPRIWDLSSYSVLTQGYCRDSLPSAVDFGPHVVVVGYADGRVRCFDAEEGGLLWQISDVHKGGVSALAVSNNQVL